MVEESDKSDSWGVELIDEILGKFNHVSGKMSENRNGDQEKHLLIGSTRPKIAKEVSKNMVTKKVVKGLYPNRYKSDNKFTSIPPTMSAWCKERQIKGYGPKIMNSQSTDSIEKKTKVEIKDENPLKSSEIISVQTSKTSSILPIDMLENHSESKNMNDMVGLDIKKDTTSQCVQVRQVLLKGFPSIISWEL